MTIVISKFIAPLVLALALAVAGSSAAQAACLSSLDAQKAAESGEIKSLAAVLASAGIDGSVEILSRQVCDEGGRLVYVIGVIKDGEAQNLVLDAQ
ncbi:hypothetical protein [uncultured Devosia sp.]|uniref:hypothetical protein n=1 Tax=uncultured Devosia sp. TaxID=211434 RepID=UPI0035CAB3A0